MPAAAVTVSGRAPLSARVTGAVIRAVLRGERRRAAVSLRFLGRDQMRELHRRFRGASGPTDVLAFALRGPADVVVGDVYVCPWVAAREARARGVPLREELVRDIVHGVLHVLGYDHPEGPTRERSAMWRRQERYVKALR
jgi:rRNA maturation RNase YbeY